MKWQCGITTVPERAETLLPQTLRSLRLAGFDRPWLFFDGMRDDMHVAEFGYAATMRDARLGMFGNWLLGLWELYLIDPGADRYAMFEDDAVFVQNLRQYLERTPYPSNGYLNLYSWPCNEQGNLPRGFHPSDQMGKGAVALVFDGAAVNALLRSQGLAGHPSSSPRWRIIRDGVIMRSMKAAGWTEYVHRPSLCQHVGEVSTQPGKPFGEQSGTFPGEEFDALTLLTGGR